MLDNNEPKVGDIFGINFRWEDRNGETILLERNHGVVDSITREGYIVSLKGVKTGQKCLVPHSSKYRRVTKGHYYFPESKEWISFAFFIEIKISSQES